MGVDFDRLNRRIDALKEETITLEVKKDVSFDEHSLFS